MLSSSSSSSSSSTSSGGSKKPKPDPKPDKSPTNRWRTPGQQHLYNRRLIDALRSPQPANGGARAVKEAADSALALAAHGQSRWSRAILSARPRRVLLKAAGSGARRRRRPAKAPARREPAGDGRVGERLRALGRLVPGCGKLAAPSLLEEAADYVAALEMQVRAMRALAEALSAAALSTAPAPEAGTEPSGP